MALMTLDYARKILKYDQDTGRLFWRPRPFEMFSASAHHTQMWHFKRWNTNYGDKECFLHKHSAGYFRAKIDGRNYLAHRVGWLLIHGEWPSHEIDHINGNRADNRIANLRPATKIENMHNVRMRKINTSGFTGVFWSKAAGKWTAEVRSEGRKHYLGLFDDIRSAVKARKEAADRLGFSEGHGLPREFAPHNPDAVNSTRQRVLTFQRAF